MNRSKLQPLFVTMLWYATSIILAGVASLGNAGSADFQTTRGRYLDLTTDVETSKLDAKQLVDAFDNAVVSWKSFFALPETALLDWHVTAYVMQDKRSFQQAGFLPERVPHFTQGFAYGNTVWVMLQPGDYYTRHLLLHEGVHALAINQFGGTGPSWFAEGTAELLATHQLSGNSVELGIVPQNKESVPYWGRISLIGKRRTEDEIPSIETVMRYQGDLEAHAESYAWCWASVMMLCEYPEYKAAYLAAARSGRDQGGNFTRQFYQRLLPQWPVLTARWRLLCNDLDYGFDWDRNRIDLSMSDPVWNGTVLQQQVDASRGWQSMGVRVPAQSTLEISTSGRCTIAKRDGKSWISEPSGVTIRYVNGKPLGQLLACLLPVKSANAKVLPVLPIVAVESSVQMTCQTESWLVLKINDAAGERSDNEGGYSVIVRGRR